MQTSHLDRDTIVALCTPQGAGALALLRISGPQAFTVVDRCARLSGSRKIIDQETHRIFYGKVIDRRGELIDRVMFLVMRGPKTFTGYDTVEITVHNNPFIIDALLGELVFNGARLAYNGEFSQQAYLNGKIDLIQAEAINELIGAHNQEVLKRSLATLEGTFSCWVGTVEQDLLRALALCEASFEFLDDPIDFSLQIRDIVKDVLARCAEVRGSQAQQRHIRQGIRIALIGSVNVGKSSLFNALLGDKRAIVSDRAGTTRDVIEGLVKYEGSFATLVDTAGLRVTDDYIEKEGIERSYNEAQKADIILLVYDGSACLTDAEQVTYGQIAAQFSSKILVVASKADRLSQDTDERSLSNTDQLNCQTPWKLSEHEPLYVSVYNPSSVNVLQHHVAQKITQLLSSYNCPYVLNQRHYTILTSLERLLTHTLDQCQSSVSYELLSIHLREVLEELSGLTGKSVTQNAIDKIFKEFCVGK